MIITENTNMVKVIAAAANGKDIEKEAFKSVDEEVTNLLKDFSPDSRHKLAQIVGFSTQEALEPLWAEISRFADVKRSINSLDLFQFTTLHNDIKAYIQAIGETTPRSRITQKKIQLPAMEISSRPYLSIDEMTSGIYKIADMVNFAKAEIENKASLYLLNVLIAAGTSRSEPYFIETSGPITEATIDPAVRMLLRYGGVSIIGDIGVTAEIANFPGYKQSDRMIENFNRLGVVGNYKGAEVVNLLNPSLSLPTNYMWIIANPKNAADRDLKFGYNGKLHSMDAQHIDDKTYEIRLDQIVGAGYQVRKDPRMVLVKIA